VHSELAHARDAMRVCEAALAGSISLNQFFREWPKERNATRLFRAISENIEDRLEHLPAEFTHSYLALRLDVLLLKRLLATANSSDELFQCRQHVLLQRNLTEETLAGHVLEYFHH
jgi:hypothetical protein